MSAETHHTTALLEYVRTDMKELSTSSYSETSL